MKRIAFISPFQDHVDLADHALEFKRGEPQDVPDDLADELLKNPALFALADAPQAAPAAPALDDHQE